MKKNLVILVMTILLARFFAQEGFKMGIQAREQERSTLFNDFNEAPKRC